VDVDRSRVGRHPALVENDLVLLDPAHVPHAHHVLDLAEQAELGLADDCAAEHGRHDLGIDAEKNFFRFEPREELVHRAGFGNRLDRRPNTGREAA
jgi:hypothetical protein